MPDETVPSCVAASATAKPAVFSSRRSRRHWERVAATHAIKQAQLDSILPETWEGQVLKPIETIIPEQSDDTMTSTTHDTNAGWCAIM